MDEARRKVLLAELEDATRERDQLNSFVDVLRSRLGLGPEDGKLGAGGGAGPDEAHGGGVLPPAGTDPLEIIYEGEFVGMSMPKAAAAVLERWSPAPNHRPLKTTILLKALRKGGLKIPDSRTLYRALWSASRFHNLEGGQWGFASWYPDAARPKAAAKANGTPAEDSADEGAAEINDFPAEHAPGTPAEDDEEEVAAS